MTPAPASCDILGLEDYTKATTCQDEPATEHAACLVINAKPVPGAGATPLSSFPVGVLVARGRSER